MEVVHALCALLIAWLMWKPLAKPDRFGALLFAASGALQLAIVALSKAA